MASSLTIVMYHYVRELAGSRYPEIKALTTERFVRQLDHIEHNYTVIGMDALLEAVCGEADALPRNGALLTFDDGYRDHYETVLPILEDRGLPAAFFPPARAVLERRVLDVNKIHFVLAAEPRKDEIVAFIDGQVEHAVAEHVLATPDEYHARYAGVSRWDPPEVAYIKSMLQKGLPEPLRGRIVDDLFRRIVTGDEAAFAHELYMTLDELRVLREAGMYVGGHGYRHSWLDTLPSEAKEEEVVRSRALVGSVGTASDRWVFCYPYGAHDNELLALLRRHGCAVGLTTQVAVADLTRDQALLLPRLDTNDLPQ
jgi:peptidoglycan/xylan/chitin deacetylase (PgdA/CDA1 family)